MDDKKPIKKHAKTDEELEKAKKETEDYKGKYLRVLADYQNFEKRVYEQKQFSKDFANKDLVLKLLPVLDDLDKAEMFVKDEGLKIIKDKLFNILKQEGVEEMNILGKEFDPYVAEVIDVVEGKEDNMIVEILRKGYKHKDKILRVAQVRVSKKL